MAVRVRSKLDTDVALVLRTFGQSRVLLVANAAFLGINGRPQQPDELEHQRLSSMIEHEAHKSSSCSTPMATRRISR